MRHKLLFVTCLFLLNACGDHPRQKTPDVVIVQDAIQASSIIDQTQLEGGDEYRFAYSNQDTGLPQKVARQWFVPQYTRVTQIELGLFSDESFYPENSTSCGPYSSSNETYGVSLWNADRSYNLGGVDNLRVCNGPTRAGYESGILRTFDIEADVTPGESYMIEVWYSGSALCQEWDPACDGSLLRWGRSTSDVYSDGYSHTNYGDSDTDFVFRVWGYTPEPVCYEEVRCDPTYRSVIRRYPGDNCEADPIVIESCDADEICEFSTCAYDRPELNIEAFNTFKNEDWSGPATEFDPGDTITFYLSVKNYGKSGNFTTTFRIYRAASLIDSFSEVRSLDSNSADIVRWNRTIPADWNGDFRVEAEVNECLPDRTCTMERLFTVNIPCLDRDGDGYFSNCEPADCDDANASLAETVSCRFDGSTCGPVNLCLASCPLPPEETCNGADDDCDDAVDEENVCVRLCESNSECREGETCREGECHEGIPDYFIVPPSDFSGITVSDLPAGPETQDYVAGWIQALRDCYEDLLGCSDQAVDTNDFMILTGNALTKTLLGDFKVVEELVIGGKKIGFAYLPWNQVEGAAWLRYLTNHLDELSPKVAKVTGFLADTSRLAGEAAIVVDVLIGMVNGVQQSLEAEDPLSVIVYVPGAILEEIFLGLPYFAYNAAAEIMYFVETMIYPGLRGEVTPIKKTQIIFNDFFANVRGAWHGVEDWVLASTREYCFDSWIFLFPINPFCPIAYYEFFSAGDLSEPHPLVNIEILDQGEDRLQFKVKLKELSPIYRWGDHTVFLGTTIGNDAYQCNLPWQEVVLHGGEREELIIEWPIPEGMDRSLSYKIKAGVWKECAGLYEGCGTPDGLCSQELARRSIPLHFRNDSPRIASAVAEDVMAAPLPPIIRKGEPVFLELEGSDPEGDPLHYEGEVFSLEGSVSPLERVSPSLEPEVATRIRYKWETMSQAKGVYRFRFRVSDGELSDEREMQLHLVEESDPIPEEAMVLCPFNFDLIGDPCNPDEDGDGVLDGEDYAPLDSQVWERPPRPPKPAYYNDDDRFLFRRHRKNRPLWINPICIVDPGRCHK